MPQNWKVIAMVELTTIAASTAALNIENLRLPRRISTKDRVADVKADADRNARRAEDAVDPEAAEPMIPAPTVSLDLLAAGQQPHSEAMAWEAVAAYRQTEE